MTNEKNKGVSAKRTSEVVLLAVFILCTVTFIITFNLTRHFVKYINTVQNYVMLSHSALDLQEGSDYLTDQVRLFIITENPEHVHKYFEELTVNRRREKAIENLRGYVPRDSYSTLSSALTQSNDLMNREIYAMALMASGLELDFSTLPEELKNYTLSAADRKLSNNAKMEKAKELTFDDEYLTQKNRIKELKNISVNLMLEKTESQEESDMKVVKNAINNLFVITVLILVLNIISFIVILFLLIKPLYNMISRIQQGTKTDVKGAREFYYLSDAYNNMYDKISANEILLRHKAEHDELTGLLNRAAYNQLIAALKINATEERIAFMIIDVDFFKSINDTYGHATGDSILKKVATILQVSFRNTDYVCRIGGDEFCVIMTKCSENIREIIDRKLISIKNYLADEENGIPVCSLSIGIAISDNGFTDKLFEDSDKALYSVKNAGRNNYCIYSEN